MYGCSAKSVTFFQSYLCDRTQQVQIGNMKSDKLSVKFGVPQGSILGPLLFILYINDLPLHIKNCKTDLYADDSTIHMAGRDIIEIQPKIQQDLYEIEKWCENNNMFVNTNNKTKCMVIGTRQKMSMQSTDPLFSINSQTLQISNCEKLLGVKIDSYLSWLHQVNQVCSKIASRIYLLSKIKKYLNLESRKLFYSGYILPLIDYCIIIWGSCSTECLNRIVKLQKRAARLILDTDFLAPSAPLFEKLGWMTVYNRITYHKCVLIFKCLNDEAPSYLIEKTNYISQSNHYQLRSAVSGDLCVPKSKTELFKKSFCFSGPSTWNSLPVSVRNSKSIVVFKNKLKSYLLHKQIVSAE